MRLWGGRLTNAALRALPLSSAGRSCQRESALVTLFRCHVHIAVQRRSCCTCPARRGMNSPGRPPLLPSSTALGAASEGGSTGRGGGAACGAPVVAALAARSCRTCRRCPLAPPPTRRYPQSPTAAGVIPRPPVVRTPPTRADERCVYRWRVCMCSVWASAATVRCGCPCGGRALVRLHPFGWLV